MYVFPTFLQNIVFPLLWGITCSEILLKAPPQVDPEEEYEMATVRPADFAKAKQQKEREEMDRYVFSEQNLHLKQFD